MSQELFISLKNIKFWGFHGVFPEERILGNWFIVHLEVLLSTEKNILNLNETVDYGQLYNILKAEMSIPTPLLEELAQRVINACLERFLTIQQVTVEIEKCRPAIGLLDGNSSIRIAQERSK